MLSSGALASDADSSLHNNWHKMFAACRSTSRLVSRLAGGCSLQLPRVSPVRSRLGTVSGVVSGAVSGIALGKLPQAGSRVLSVSEPDRFKLCLPISDMWHDFVSQGIIEERLGRPSECRLRQYGQIECRGVPASPPFPISISHACATDRSVPQLLGLSLQLPRASESVSVLGCNDGPTSRANPGFPAFAYCACCRPCSGDFRFRPGGASDANWRLRVRFLTKFVNNVPVSLEDDVGEHADHI